MPRAESPYLREIQRLLSQGHTPRDIAKRLDLSKQAVYAHMETLKAEAADESTEAVS